MVNYNRMEEVPRAFGPLEPIGPAPSERRRGASSAGRPTRRVSYAARNMLLGTVAFVVVGGALGAYFRPDFGEEPARGGPIEAPVEPADGDSVDIMVTDAAPAAPSALPEDGMAIDVSAIIAQPPAPMEMTPPPLGPVAEGPAQAPYAVAPPARAERPFAAARRAFQRMTRAEAEPASTAPRGSPPAAAPRPQPQVYARNDAPAPAPVRPAPPIPPIMVARADPPRAAAVAATPSPSFDCGSARSVAQRTVCEDSGLAALDRRLAAEFERAIAAGHDRAALHLDQDHWLARREAAAPDPRAVAEAYERRIRQLRSMR